MEFTRSLMLRALIMLFCAAVVNVANAQSSVECTCICTSMMADGREVAISVSAPGGGNGGECMNFIGKQCVTGFVGCREREDNPHSTDRVHHCDEDGDVFLVADGIITACYENMGAY